MKTSLPLSALALAALALASPAWAEDAKSFDVAARSDLSQAIAEANGRADRQTAPIVVEILSWDYLPDRAGVSQDQPAEQRPVSAPSKPAKRP